MLNNDFNETKTFKYYLPVEKAKQTFIAEWTAYASGFLPIACLSLTAHLKKL